MIAETRSLSWVYLRDGGEGRWVDPCLSQTSGDFGEGRVEGYFFINFFFHSLGYSTQLLQAFK